MFGYFRAKREDFFIFLRVNWVVFAREARRNFLRVFKGKLMFLVPFSRSAEKIFRVFKGKLRFYSSFLL